MLQEKEVLPMKTEYIYDSKGKVFPLQARCGPEDG